MCMRTNQIAQMMMSKWTAGVLVRLSTDGVGTARSSTAYVNFVPAPVSGSGTEVFTTRSSESSILTIYIA